MLISQGRWQAKAGAGVLMAFLMVVVAAGQAISRVPTITTFAGGGTPGYSGDGSAATGAVLNAPAGVAIDKAGNLYIADTANNRIRKIAVGTGIITTFAGNGTAGYSGDNGPATSAELQSPTGVTIDSSGNLYIADQGNNVVRRVPASNIISTVAGNNKTGYSGDNGPATQATLYAPTAVTVDSAGNLYIADSGNNRVRAVNTAGVITTFAGNSTAGYTGDNGPAASATLSNPSAVLVGSGGLIYILDSGNNVLRQVSSAGVITTIAGNGNAGYDGDHGPATSATLNDPMGLTLDAVGNLYLSDTGNDVVRIVSTTGIINTFAGKNFAAFNHPQGLTVDSQGNLYIADVNNAQVREINTPVGSISFPTTTVGTASTVVPVPLQINAEGTSLTSLAVPASQGAKQEYSIGANNCALNTPLPAGTLCNVQITFTPAYPGSRPAPLQVASSAGTFNFGLTGTGSSPLAILSPGILSQWANVTVQESDAMESATGGLTVDSSGNVYAAVVIPNYHVPGEIVLEFNAGNLVAMSAPLDSGSFGLALDSPGNVYAASPQNSCIYKFAPGLQTQTVVAGSCLQPGLPGSYSGDYGLATNAQLNDPKAVAVDTSGNIYIADSGNNRIRKVAVGSGVITTVAGTGSSSYGGDNGPAVQAQLLGPSALALDNVGNLYIADSGNARIRKLNLVTGIITTVAGNGTSGYTGDNGPATSAELEGLVSLTTDAAGNIYFLDGLRNVVRTVNSAGIITTTADFSTIRANVGETGIALDSAANLYFAGGGFFVGVPGPITEANVSSSALTFSSQQIGLSATQSVTLTNAGNAPLVLTVPTVTAGFTLDKSSTCQPTLSLSAGASCSLAVDYTPATTAAVTGTLSIPDNSLNASQTQTVQLSGAAGQTIATTTAINVATPYFGQTQVSATIAAVSGTLVPAGSVVFTVDGTAEPAIPLDSSGIAPLPASISIALASGQHTIAAVYTSSGLGFGNSNATLIFSVSQTPPSVTVAPTTTTLTVTPGEFVTDTITVTPVAGYTGALQFSCTGMPQNATCTFQPATVTLTTSSTQQTTLLTIQTTGTTALRQTLPFEGVPWLPAAAFWLPAGLFPALRKRRLWLGGLLLILAGCSGGGSSTPAPNLARQHTGTPPGTSAIQVIATNSGATVQSFTINLTVQ